MASERPARLDLTRPRAYGELLQTSFELFARNAGVFLTLALVLVTPAALLVDGVWGRALADGAEAEPSLEAQTVSAALRVFVILPLVTAANVAIVTGVASRGAAPTAGDALRAGARVFPRVLGAVAAYVAVVLAGLILLIVPGIWLAVRCYFAAQAAVIDGVGARGALRASSELVDGSWWRTLGCLVGTGLIFGVAGSVVIALVGATDSAALYVAGLIVVEAAAVSLTATFATLLFFDLRARKGRPVDAPPD